MSLVVLAPNWLGDAVMALPAVADLRRSDPARRLMVAARPSVAGLFEMVPGVDGVVRLAGAAEGGSWRRFAADVERLRAAGARRAVLLPNSARSALAVWRAGIPERCGYRRDLRGWLLTQAVDRPARGAHQVDDYRHLVAQLGAAPGPREPALEVPPPLGDEGRAILVREGWDGARPLLGVAPGAAFGGAKRWPDARFAAAVAALGCDPGMTSVLVGSQADRDVACAIEQEAGKIAGMAGRGRVINLAGRTTLGQLAGVLACCAALLSNDSGAMHLAAALGLPVVAVFGPTDERATAPVPRTAGGVARPVRTIVGEAWCRPCGWRECPIDHRCMTRVGVDTVVHAVKDVL